MTKSETAWALIIMAGVYFSAHFIVAMVAR